MMGMEEKPGGRPLMLGGWPGKGVSAGDKGKLLYTQHIRGAGRDDGEETQALSFKTKQQQKNNNQKKPKSRGICAYFSV